MAATKDQPKGRVLVVAGSDSGGGAGIQADIKAITALGGYAATAVTAITIQNTLGVQGVVSLAPNAVRAQMQAVLSDIGADAIKTGMLGEAALIETVAETLEASAKGVPVIVDPVMVATSGDRLLPAKAVDTLKALMVPGCALLTPNAPEAEILSDKAVDGINGQRRAAERLLNMGARAVLVKGGHVPGNPIIDVLATERGEVFIEGERIETMSTHGTGCTLASAIAVGVARGLMLEDAVRLAHAYLAEAIWRAPGLGKGHGPVDHGWPARDPEAFASMLAKAKLA